MYRTLRRRRAAKGARHAQDVRLAAIGVQAVARMPGFARRQHHGAGAVAEQHAGGAVVEIENAREHFGADHQHVLVHAGADEASAVDSAYTKPLHTAARRRRRRCW
jgi:hypothetical protein